MVRPTDSHWLTVKLLSNINSLFCSRLLTQLHSNIRVKLIYSYYFPVLGLWYQPKGFVVYSMQVEKSLWKIYLKFAEY